MRNLESYGLCWVVFLPSLLVQVKTLEFGLLILQIHSQLNICLDIWYPWVRWKRSFIRPYGSSNVPKESTCFCRLRSMVALILQKHCKEKCLLSALCLQFVHSVSQLSIPSTMSVFTVYMQDGSCCFLCSKSSGSFTLLLGTTLASTH